MTTIFKNGKMDFRGFKTLATKKLVDNVNLSTKNGDFVGHLLDGIFYGSRNCHWNSRREENVHWFSPPGLCKWEDEVVIEPR
jgi:hypothetical protein